MEKISEKICGQNYTITMRQCRKRSTEKEDCGTGLLHEEDCVGRYTYTEKDCGTGLLHEEDCVGRYTYTEKDRGTGLSALRGLCMKTENRYEKGPCAMDVLKGTVPYFQRYSEQFGETCGTGQLISIYGVEYCTVYKLYV
jgi:hypothetical protein